MNDDIGLGHVQRFRQHRQDQRLPLIAGMDMADTVQKFHDCIGRLEREMQH